MRQIIIFISIVLLSTQNLSGQYRNIQGRVISEDFELLPGVRIQNTDTVLIGKTDVEGNFSINIPRETEKLLLSWIGMEWTTIQLPKDCNTPEIIMMYDATYDFMSPKKIDKLRKKRFDQLPEIHSKAYRQGMFQSEKPCYVRKFKPIKPALEEIGKQMELKSAEIKRMFKSLSVGDTIKIPFSGSYRHDGTDRTSLFAYSYVVEDSGFDCLIVGVITEKNKRKRGYNIVFKVTNLDLCSYDSIVYNGNNIGVGDSVSHNMKYFEVLVD